MSQLTVKNISSLEKVMPVAECPYAEINSQSALINEEFSYQIAYKASDVLRYRGVTSLVIESDLAECISVYCVKRVPVTYGAGADVDEHYLTYDAAMIPDVLEPYDDCVSVSSEVFNALWVSVKPGKQVKPGAHTVTVRFMCQGEEQGVSKFSLQVVGVELPPLDIPNTTWFHCDCIADWHGCEVFSEQHWELIDRYMQVASCHGANMLLTPVITPPLDTLRGTERPTVQLVDIACDNGVYSFGFEKLQRWLALFKKNKIEYVEVAHLYSQWGGDKTPKVVVTENGQTIKKFGWQTDALCDEYKNFISQFVPALTAFFAANWDKDKVYFHLTDEPSREHIEHYGELYRFVKPLLGDFKQMDALSDYELYAKGYVDVPVVLTPSVRNFLGKDVPELWAYTCCDPYNGNYSNRFMAMPSWRNRMMGLQLYKHDIDGFLHWGYNFYYSRYSVKLVNPYTTTDAEGAFPAGDCYMVYPAPGGAIPSLRYKVFLQGLQDMMAAKLLERFIGKEEVMRIVETEGEVAFDICPKDAAYIMNIREKINQKLLEVCSN